MENSDPNSNTDVKKVEEGKADQATDVGGENEEEWDYYDEEDEAELTEEQLEKKKKFMQYIEIFEGVCDTLSSPEI